MKSIVISVEGDTEERFVKEILAPYFLSKDIFVQNPISLGGYKTYNKIRKEILALVNRTSVDLVTTLYDYYGLERINSFANLNFSNIRGCSCVDKVKIIEEAFADNIDHPKFLPYIQLHEFEAFLFIDPVVTSSNLFKCNTDSIHRTIATALNEADNNPEFINNDPSTAPSKRILGAYPRYNKVSDGTIICNELGITRIMEKCPRFKQWIISIESKLTTL